MAVEISLKTKSKQIYLYVRRIFLSYCIRPFLFKTKSLFKKDEIKTILVIRIDCIGDIVVSLAGLKALKEAYPKSRISILVRGGRDKLLDGIPWVDEIILYKGFIKAARHLRRFSFDLVIDLSMDYVMKTALLAYAISAKYSAGFDIGGRGCFFNIKYKPSAENKHMSRHILDLVMTIAGSSFRPAGNFESFYLRLPVSKDNRKDVRKYLIKNGIREEDLIVGIHPGGNYPSQRWPMERFSQIIDKVTARYQAKVVIMGDPTEKTIMDEAAKLIKGKGVTVAFGFPLDKLATLISMTDLLICNNSGLLHMACALEVPTVSTMGPTDPRLWWPMGGKNIVIRKDLPCSPCDRGSCKSHDCMKLITTEEVMDAVQGQLDKIKHVAEHPLCKSV